MALGTILLSVLGGSIIGALSRQPEINNLKKQVRQLQGEVERLQKIIHTQDKQIRTLLVRYKSLKAYQFNEKSKARSYVRGALIFQYAYKEYLELLMKSIDNNYVDMNNEESIFFNIFDKIIEGQDVSDNERQAIKEYILYRYKIQIDNLEECNTDYLIERLQKYND